MNKRFAVLLGMGLLAGCGGESPTATAEAAGASLTGGVIFGSGHKSDSDSTSIAPQGSTADTQSSGGVMFGSGH
jgi:hypothetical protein